MLLHITMATLHWELPAPAENSQKKCCSSFEFMLCCRPVIQQTTFYSTVSLTIPQPEKNNNYIAEWEVPNVDVASNRLMARKWPAETATG